MKKFLCIALLLIASSKASEPNTFTRIEVSSPWLELKKSFNKPLKDMNLEELYDLQEAFEERELLSGMYDRYHYLNNRNELIAVSEPTCYSHEEFNDIAVQYKLIDKTIKEKSQKN